MARKRDIQPTQLSLYIVDMSKVTFEGFSALVFGVILAATTLPSIFLVATSLATRFCPSDAFDVQPSITLLLIDEACGIAVSLFLPIVLWSAVLRRKYGEAMYLEKYDNISSRRTSAFSNKTCRVALIVLSLAALSFLVSYPCTLYDAQCASPAGLSGRYAPWAARIATSWRDIKEIDLSCDPHEHDPSAWDYAYNAKTPDGHDFTFGAATYYSRSSPGTPKFLSVIAAANPALSYRSDPTESAKGCTPPIPPEWRSGATRSAVS